MDTFIAKLVEAYEQAERELLFIVSRQLQEGIDEDTWAQQKLASIAATRKQLVEVLTSLKQLDAEAQAQLLQQFLAGAGTQAEGFIATNEGAINNMLAAQQKLLTDMRFQILRQTEDAYRRIVAESTQAASLGIDTRIVAARRSLAKFAGAGITGFVDRSGRRVDMASYVEMATRTSLLNSYRQGRVTRLQADGKDLVIVSSVPNPSDLCKPYERKILSISGSSDKYPSLDSAKANGLFHPNCRHSFTAYVPGLTKAGDTDADRGFDDYEATQEQRSLERKIRAWKRRLTVADSENAKQTANAKIKTYRGELKSLIEEYDLVRKPNREGNVQAR